MDLTKLKRVASAGAVGEAVIPESALTNTPGTKGDSKKREASSPLIPPEPQLEKKSREGSSSAEFGDTLTCDGDMADDEQEHSSVTESPSMHIFSEPMHPSDILHVASELRTLMLPEISSLMEDQKPDIRNIVCEAIREATSSLTAELHSVKAENTELKHLCNEPRLRVAKLELENDTLDQYGRRNILRVSSVKEQGNEETDDIVFQLANDLDVPMTKQDIDR